MYQFEATLGFQTKTKEQADYILGFLDDLQALITCETSTFQATEITEIKR